MIDAIHLRRRVRWVLCALPKNRRLSDEIIFDKLISGDFPGLKPDEMHTALLWNQARGLVDVVKNEDDDRHEWRLTPEGWRKEGLRGEAMQRGGQ